MIGWLAQLLLPSVGERFAKPLAWAILIIIAILLFLTAKAMYDRGVIEEWTDDANEQFDRDFEDAIGQQDRGSDDRRFEHEERIKTTEELIDEALEKGCAVGEYLASDGDECVLSGTEAGLPGSGPS